MLKKIFASANEFYCEFLRCWFVNGCYHNIGSFWKVLLDSLWNLCTA